MTNEEIKMLLMSRLEKKASIDKEAKTVASYFADALADMWPSVRRALRGSLKATPNSRINRIAGEVLESTAPKLLPIPSVGSAWTRAVNNATDFSKMNIPKLRGTRGHQIHRLKQLGDALQNRYNRLNPTALPKVFHPTDEIGLNYIWNGFKKGGVGPYMDTKYLEQAADILNKAGK